MKDSGFAWIEWWEKECTVPRMRVSGGSEALEILGTWEGLQPKRLFVVTVWRKIYSA